MQQPPNPNLQNRQFLPPSPLSQPQTYYPPQQPPIPPKKRVSRTGKIVLAVIGAVVSIFILSIIIAIANTSTAPPIHTLNATATANANNLTATTIANNATVSAGATAITSNLTQIAMTPTPTDTPVPTPSPDQSEATYKASTTNTSIATLDKDGNADQGKDVHFTCTILNFVKNSNGNTAGANVDDPNTSGVVQIAFPTNTDLSRLNTGDTLEVWGTDEGTQSGQNAFGATIQEVVVSANYMTDETTNYQVNG